MSLGGSFSCVRRPKRIDWGSLNSAHCSPAADGLKVVHMDAVKELRKAKRYRLSAPAVFEWASQGGDPHGGQGVTRDVNASGVYVFADALPPVGALVHLEILLPKLTGPGVADLLDWRRRSVPRRAPRLPWNGDQQGRFRRLGSVLSGSDGFGSFSHGNFRASCVSPGL